MVRGLVVARAGPRKVSNAFLTTLTLRDERLETITLTIWSDTEDQALHLDQLGRVGSVLEVAQPTVLAKTASRGESYDPVTSSKLKLKFNHQSRLRLVPRTEAEELYQSLASPNFLGMETMSLKDTMTLEMRGRYCSLLVTIQKTKSQFEVNGKKVKEIRVFDDSHDTGVLKLWEPEQRTVAEAWQPRRTVLLLTNVLIEFDSYRSINVIAGTSRTVITVDPDIWDTYYLRIFAQTSVFSSVQRLETFVAGTPLAAAKSASQRVTVLDIKQLCNTGAISEAEALRFVSVLAKVTFANLRDETCVTLSCRSCDWPVVEFGDTTDCENFSCTITPASRLPVSKFTMSADILDATGSLSGLVVSQPFLVELLKDPESFMIQPMWVKKNCAKLISYFAEIFLALELPLRSQVRPFRGMVISAD